MPTITKAPAVASNERTSPPVRGSAFAFVETASTATVELGDAATASTATVEPGDAAPGKTVVVDVVDAVEVVVAAGSFTVTTGVHEQAVDEMVVVVVAILGDVVHGLRTVVASGEIVRSSPSLAVVSLTKRS